MMTSFWRWESFAVGVAVTLGIMSWLSLQFGGPGHVPPIVELPGIALTSMLDSLPVSITTSVIWPGLLFYLLESLLDNYRCPYGHEYRVEIVNHNPPVLRFHGFLLHHESEHLLKLVYYNYGFETQINDSGGREHAPSYVSHWTADDPSRIYLEPDEDRVVACLEKRIANMSGYSIHRQEPMQV